MLNLRFSGITCDVRRAHELLLLLTVSLLYPTLSSLAKAPSGVIMVIKQ